MADGRDKSIIDEIQEAGEMIACSDVYLSDEAQEAYRIGARLKVMTKPIKAFEGSYSDAMKAVMLSGDKEAIDNYKCLSSYVGSLVANTVPADYKQE